MIYIQHLAAADWAWSTRGGLHQGKVKAEKAANRRCSYTKNDSDCVAPPIRFKVLPAFVILAERLVSSRLHEGAVISASYYW